MRTILRTSMAILTIVGSVVALSPSVLADEKLEVGEKFVDAFYSFDRARLEATLTDAKASAPKILFYQGWAKGGHYEVVRRYPCAQESPAEVSCSITVKDDLIQALRISFHVTDTFHLTISAGKITAVRTTSDDPQEFRDAEAWVKKERAEQIREPCEGYFAGGPTPEKCVQAMVRGFVEYAASGGPSSK